MPYDDANQFFSFALYFYWKEDVIRAKKCEKRFTLRDFRYKEVQHILGKIMNFMHDFRMTYNDADYIFWIYFHFLDNLSYITGHNMFNFHN